MSPFRADCSQCCGLCCVVPDQLAIQGFPVDKPSNTPCRHLDAAARCAIHAHRYEHGYAACTGFDCYGAGPWVTQKLQAAADESDARLLAARGAVAYRFWLPRFEAAALLDAALPHVDAQAQNLLRARIRHLMEVPDGDRMALGDASRLRRDTLALIRSVLARG
jgi:hypothetical protein